MIEIDVRFRVYFLRTDNVVQASDAMWLLLSPSRRSAFTAPLSDGRPLFVAPCLENDVLN